MAVEKVNETLRNKDGRHVRRKAEKIQFVVFNEMLKLQFLKVLLKADRTPYHFCYSLPRFRKRRLLRSLPATSKLLNKLIWGQIVNLVRLLHPVVCFGVAAKRLTWRQMLFGLCKCWSCLRGEQEDKMINVCQRGTASLMQKIFFATSGGSLPRVVFKGPNRARWHVLQTTAALIWEVVSTSRGPVCFAVRGLIINWWMSLWSTVI